MSTLRATVERLGEPIYGAGVGFATPISRATKNDSYS
jgi:hypothetical protein